MLHSIYRGCEFVSKRKKIKKRGILQEELIEKRGEKKIGVEIQMREERTQGSGSGKGKRGNCPGHHIWYLPWSFGLGCSNWGNGYPSDMWRTPQERVWVDREGNEDMGDGGRSGVMWIMGSGRWPPAVCLPPISRDAHIRLTYRADPDKPWGSEQSAS